MKESLYNAAEFIAHLMLPIGGSLFFILAFLMDIPHGREIVGVCLIVVAVLDAVLARRGCDGCLMIDRHDPDKDVYRLDLGDQLDALSSKRKIVLSIDPNARLGN